MTTTAPQGPSVVTPPDAATRLDLYRTMVLARTFEEAILREYHADKGPGFDIGKGLVPGEMHLSAGQEPVAAGVCAHLTPDDAVTATHRPHHFAIAHGVDLDRMTAEIFGRESGLGHGRGGHMHLFDPAAHFSCSGIIAEGYPPALGQAFAFRHQGTDRVAVAVTGEGAANQGAFHESLNLPRCGSCRSSSSSRTTTGDLGAALRLHRRCVQRRPGRGLRHAGRARRGQRRRGGLRRRRARGRAGPRRRRPDADRGAHTAPVGPLRGRRAGLPPGAGDVPGPTRSRGYEASCATRGVLDDARPRGGEEAMARSTEAFMFAKQSPLPDPADAPAYVFV